MEILVTNYILVPIISSWPAKYLFLQLLDLSLRCYLEILNLRKMQISWISTDLCSLTLFSMFPFALP